MSETNQTPQQVLVYPQYPAQEEDEINLFDLWQTLVKQKKTIFGITAVITIIAILYALLATPVYKTKTVFLPPSDNDIQNLNIKDVIDFDVDSVYSRFKENLGSIANRKIIFEQMKLIDQFVPEMDENTNVDEIFNAFNKDITLNIASSKKGQFFIPITTLSLEGNDPVLIMDIVNHLANKAEQTTKVELISNIEAKVNQQITKLKLDINLLLNKTKIKRLDEIKRLETSDSLQRIKIQDQIIVLKNSAKEKRLDTIASLTEANKIAHSLGLKGPLDYKLKKIGAAATQQSQIMTDMSNESTELYTLGYEALEAKIDSLTKRTNDEPFIEELRGLEDKLKLLETNRTVEQLKSRTDDAPFIAELRGMENTLAYFESIKIDPKSINVAHLDQAAFIPEKKIKPKRKLIVILGLVIGLILGVLTAFIRNLAVNKN